MKLREKFKYLKKEYSDSVVLLKSGSFYITYDNDALIMNNVFNYQNINNKVGFPIRSVDKVMNSLNELNISYVIDNNDETDILEFLSEDNEYLKYYELAKKDEFKDSLNKILLDKIKFLIESDNDNYEKIRRFIDEL